MTLIYVKDEKMAVKDLTRMIEKATDMNVLKLESVVLDGTEDDIISLSKAIRGHPYLEEFRWSDVTLTDLSLTLNQVVSMLFVTVPDLHVVQLEKLPITTSALATAGYCTSLRQLLLPNSNLNDKDATFIADAIAKNPVLEVIDLSANDLSDIGCVAFANALQKNTSIREIKLGGNGNISSATKSQIETTLRNRDGGSAQAA
jgi:Ran GTPase-activating protein (RanGAP) involved in mRNA processing and transport